MAEEEEAIGVQLGYSEPISEDDGDIGHASAAWGAWDGGQIGGKPSWLNPQHLPKKPLECRSCSSPNMRFLCQLYAPADDINDDAYHRSLYIFACPSCKDSPEGSVRVLRCQLPEDNAYYPPTDNTTDWSRHLSSSHGVDLCQVCGQRGKGKCPVQGVSFCCREHQLEHKKFVKNKTEKDKKPFLPSVYAKSELVVEEEPEPEHTEEREALIEAEENDSDEDLEQEDIDEMMGKTTTQDPMTTDFYTRVKRSPDQCLRYYPKWRGEELWIRSTPLPRAPIPTCDKCGADRKCEFQIMPQLLYHLLQNHKEHQKKEAFVMSAEGKQALSVASEIVEHAPPEQVPPLLKERHDETVEKIQKHLLESDDDELDFGVIAVYTCTASCSGENEELGAYREEYAWKQPPP